jgi:hypothetical protein
LITTKAESNPAELIKKLKKRERVVFLCEYNIWIIILYGKWDFLLFYNVLNRHGREPFSSQGKV